MEGQLKGKLELILDVQRANWSSEGHLGVQIGSDSAASADCTRKICAQEASKTSKLRTKKSEIAV